MKQNGMRFFTLFVALIAVTTVGCGQHIVAESAHSDTAYASALSADYENALDTMSQLALGTLHLEGTADAVTEEQVTTLLALWELLQGTALQGAAERAAVIQQIEATLTEAQVMAIVAMQLTQADAQAWLQEQGGAGSGGQPGAGGGAQRGQGASGMSEEDRAAMRERFQSMSEEERAEVQAQFMQQGSSGGAAPAQAMGASSGALLRAVVRALEERAGSSLSLWERAREREVEPITPTLTLSPTPADRPTSSWHLRSWHVPSSSPEHVPPQGERASDAADESDLPEESTLASPAQTMTATTESDDVKPSASQASTVTSPSTPEPTTSGMASAPVSTPAGIVQGALEQIPDDDPGPPLTIEITTNSATPNQNLEGGQIYKVAGTISNPTDQVYSLSAIHVTFYDAEGFRGAFYVFEDTKGRERSGEWVRHGKTEASFACLLLGPGESCPFSVQIEAQDMAAFLVHPDAIAVEWREPVSVALSDLNLVDEGTSYLHIKGTAVNNNPYPVKNVAISGLLLDGNGQSVSMGATYVIHIEANSSARFNLYIEKQPYVKYDVHVQAEQDAK